MGAKDSRQAIENGYKILGGRIHEPGKFEGEPIYTPYLYDLIMDGQSDMIGQGDIITLDNDDREAFPELGEAAYAHCEEDSQGFFYVKLLYSFEERMRFEDDAMEAWEPEE